jgi:hypothetical protein
MTPRRLEERLIAAALVLAGVQALLLAALYAAPEPPEVLPEQDMPERSRARTEEEPAPDNDRVAVQVLDQLLEARVRAAAARAGRDPTPLLPPPGLREAALGNPDPAGPAVDALLKAYVSTLSEFGETLDAATSTPGTATLP